eukprot:CCRYP_015701-RA/>CCRYP_015701-RA protein AED:0.60 eAED:0.34 QI:0/-1/0/1/-1/0/1/0/100
MVKSNPNKQKPWTCFSTGCAIANVKNNFESTGDHENYMTLTTGPSTTLPPTIKTFAQNLSCHTQSSECYILTSNNEHHMQQLQLKDIKHALLQGCDNDLP